MIAPSPALRSAVADMAPEDLKAWALQRLRGESTVPMIYQGKEQEQPNEAVTAAFRLGGGVLDDGKREALLDAMKELQRELLGSILEKRAGENQVVGARRWAEVVEIAKPDELSAYASSLLHACLEDSAQMRPALAQVAAAANAFSNEEVNPEDSALLWKRLLAFPETAALAFRRILPTFHFTECAKGWIELLQHRVKDGWPTNVRMLLSALLDSKEADLGYLARGIERAGMLSAALDELKHSHDESVASLVEKLHQLEKREESVQSSQIYREKYLAQIEASASLIRRRLIKHFDSPFVISIEHPLGDDFFTTSNTFQRRVVNTLRELGIESPSMKESDTCEFTWPIGQRGAYQSDPFAIIKWRGIQPGQCAHRYSEIESENLLEIANIQL